jgi:uncharacterized repeat protein (TIGR01451 family)
VKLSLALVGLAMVVLVMFVPGSSAVELNNPFELDGNALVDHPGAGLPDDWSRVYDPGTYGAGGYFSHTFIGGNIEAPGNDQTYFTGGGSKDVNDIPQWNWTPTPTPAAPDKDEITDAFGATYAVSSGPDTGHTVLYFGMDRYAQSGDSNVGFWFMQDPTFGLNSDGTFSGQHQNGDLFVLSAFGNGGSSPTVTVYQWDNGNLDTVSTGTPCTSDSIACAVVNTGSAGIPVPWPYTPKAGTPGTVPQNGFFEGGIDLDRLLGAGNVPCFADFLGETRSSDSTSAQLKDLVLGSIQTCGSIELKKHWDGKAGSTTLTIGKTIGGSEVTSKAVAGKDDTTGPFEEKAGTYYLNETPITNYSSDPLSCVNTANGGSTPVSVGASNAVQLGIGDQIVCTFVNHYVKASPTIATLLSGGNPASITVGGTIHDSATFTGYRAPSTGTSTVTYTVYTNNTCTTAATTEINAQPGSVNVNQTTGAVPNSANVTFNKAGTYYWQASFSGDDDNNATTSPCTSEVVTVNKATPTLTTTASGPVTVGSAIHDTAHLGGGFNLTGTVTFDVYNSTCSTKLNGSPIGAMPATVGGPGDYVSADFTPTSAGTYRWVAHYSGDVNNNSLDTNCDQTGANGETSVVNPAHPSIATQLSSSSITVGDTINDTATISNAFNPTGTVTYTVYTNNSCSSMATTEINAQPGTVTLTAGHLVPDSPGVKFLKAGTYYWQAAYSGDTNNQPPAVSPCQSEVVTVAKAKPTVATTLHNAANDNVVPVSPVSHLPLGSTLYDVASLTGVTGIPFAGTVTFTFFSNDSCTPTGTPEGNVTITGSSAKSSNHGPLGAGSYSFNAKYVAGSDPNYVDSDPSSCEPFVIDKAQLSVTTTVHEAGHSVIATNAHVALGTNTHDNAKVSGAVAGFAVPAVSFTFDGSGIANGTTEASFDATSVASGPLGAGDHAYSATVAGNANYLGATSDPEPFTVDKKQLTITTTVHDSAHAVIATNAHVPLGTDTHDNAKVGGAVAGFAIPAVSFTLDGSGVANAASAEATFDATSVASGPLGAGDHAYSATVASNANYIGATSDPEPFTVDKKQLTITTTVHDGAHAVIANNAHVPLGTNSHDNAKVGGAVAGFAIPAISFTFDGSGVANASTEASFDATSAASGPLGAGNHAYSSTVASNANYIGATSDPEPFVVDKKQLTITTTVHDGAHAVIANNAHVPLGTNSHDNATVSGAVNGFAIPAVTFTFDGSSIANAASPEATFDATTVASGPLGAGSHTYSATVASNANYIGATSDPEPFTVDKKQLTITTTVHDGAHAVIANNAHVQLGTNSHDNATVSGAVNGFAIPAVSFTFDGSGVANAASAEATFDATSVASGPLGAGNHTYSAAVASNANYIGGTSDPEPFVVDKAQLAVSTLVHDATHADITGKGVPFGSVVHDTAHVTGQVAGFTPSGGVTFTFYTAAACSNGTAISTDGTDAGNGDIRTVDTLPLTAGTYGFIATAVGDSNYLGATGTCESFDVGKTTPTVATTLHNANGDAVVANGTHLPLGTSMYDVATLTGVQGIPFTGTVTFTFFSNDSCAPTGTPQGSVTITGSTAKSSTHGPLGAGSYSFDAKYVADGDPNYTDSDPSSCEPFVIDKAQLAVSTTVHDGTHAVIANNAHVALGTNTHDNAKVTGAVDGFAIPAISFTLDGSSAANAASAEASFDATTVASGPLGAGSHTYSATVAGNDNYVGATSAPEPFVVDKAQLSVSTTVHNTSHAVIANNAHVPLGTNTHDNATVSGAVNGFPIPGISFTFDGSGVANAASAEASFDATSAASGPLAAGNHTYSATVAGNANYLGATSAPEPFVVDKAQLAVTTLVHDAAHTDITGKAVPFGSVVHDTAHVTGQVEGFTPAGGVTFTFYAAAECSNGTAIATNGADAGNGDVRTVDTLPLNAGTYGFKAVAVGDSNYLDGTGACESFTVNKTAPTISTTLSATEVVVGTAVHDSATLTGASSTAGGTVSYSVYNNNTCSGTPTDAGTKTVTSGNVPNSNDVTFNTAGDFYWQAVYSGDGNNLPATSPCTSEHLVVDKPAIAITKLPATQTVNLGATATFTITVTNTGSVTLTNVTVSDPLSPNCSKTLGTLAPGQSTSFTCTQSGVSVGYTNVATATGHPPVGPDVTAQASAVVNVVPPGGPEPTPTVDLQIVKTASPTSLQTNGTVTWTLAVKNNGPVTDTNVKVADSLPAGLTFVSVSSTQGTCTGGNLVQCTIGTMNNQQVVTITIVTTATTAGTITNTATVVGDLPETNTANNTSSATITVTSPPPPPAPKPPAPKPAPKPVFKPPVVKPKPKPVPPPCYAVVVAPKSLTVGKNGKLNLVVTAKNKPIVGTKVEVKGPGILVLSNRTDRHGHVTLILHPTKPGIVLVKPASYKGCTNPRIGVIAAFTPPVTG